MTEIEEKFQNEGNWKENSKMTEIEGKFQNDGNPSIDGQLEALLIVDL